MKFLKCVVCVFFAEHGGTVVQSVKHVVQTDVLQRTWESRA